MHTQTGTAIIMFAQTLGGAIFVPVGQNVFLSTMQAKVSVILPGIDVKNLYAQGGATSIRNVLSGELLDRVLEAFSA